MKKLFSLFLFLSVLVAGAQNATPLDSSIWKCNYPCSLNQAKEEGKPLLMVFSGSDWCKPCIMLREQILVKPEFCDWAKTNVVCVSLDFPSQKKNRLPQYLQQQNDSLAEKFNPNGIFPLVVIIDGSEKILGTAGYKDVSPFEFISDLEKIVKQ